MDARIDQPPQPGGRDRDEGQEIKEGRRADRAGGWAEVAVGWAWSLAGHLVGWSWAGLVGGDGGGWLVAMLEGRENRKRRTGTPPPTPISIGV